MVTPSQLTVLITAMGTPSQFILHAFEKGVLKIPNCLTKDVFFFTKGKFSFTKHLFLLVPPSIIDGSTLLGSTTGLILNSLFIS